MAEKKVLELSDTTFDTEVNDSTVPVLVDFWAPWCGPCRMLAPVVDRLAAKYADKLKVGKVNVDENPGVAGKFGIMSIPTLIFFKNGKEVDRVIGALPEPVLANKIEELLK
uniref:Thioredoxin n=1 Tax=candidate division WOR-3 bacterium TaxID=2052148 RepID=A0A7V3V031_UNCW3